MFSPPARPQFDKRICRSHTVQLGLFRVNSNYLSDCVTGVVLSSLEIHVLHFLWSGLIFVGLDCTFTTLFIIIQLWIQEGQGPYSEWPLKLNLNSSEGNSSAALGDSSKWRWSIGYGIHYLLSNWTSWPCLNVYSREYYNGNFINICRKENIKQNKIYHPHFLP